MDELDLSLIGALQRRPRAPWAELAEPLDADPATLSRRWARLSASGEAWVTCYPGGGHGAVEATAMVEVECRSGTVTAVAEELACDTHAVTVEIVSGRADLLLTVIAPDLRAVTDYAVQRVGTVPGVLRTRTTPLLHVLREGSRWRLGTLDARQRRAISEPAPSAASRRPAVQRDGARDRALMLALGEDGRMPHTRLRDRTGTPVTTVRRRLDELLGSGRAVLRCDAAPGLTGWPHTAVLHLDAAAEQLEETANSLAQLSRSRLCAVALGPANLLLVIVARQLTDLYRLEAEVLRGPGQVRVVERQLILRTVKLMGTVLDGQERARSRIPMAVWTDPLEAAVRSGSPR